MQCNIALEQVLYGLRIFFVIDVSSPYVTKLLFHGKSKNIDGISVIKLRLFRIQGKAGKSYIYICLGESCCHQQPSQLLFPIIIQRLHAPLNTENGRMEVVCLTQLNYFIPLRA